jgi:hypothetical protein
LDKYGALQKRFDNYIQLYNETHSKIESVNFDFHKAASPLVMNFQNLIRIFKENSIEKAFQDYGFNHFRFPDSFNFSKNEKFVYEKASSQNGVFRTNCFESLDRTNIIQFFFAMRINRQFLSYINQKQYDANDNRLNILEGIIRNQWSINGDHIGKAYASGGALFTDVVKHNKRTVFGMVNDLKVSITRYINNNFHDGYRQDCHDYFLCKIAPKRFQINDHSNIPIWMCLIYLILSFIFINNYVVVYLPHFSTITCVLYISVYAVCLYLAIILLTYISDNIVDMPTLKTQHYY